MKRSLGFMAAFLILSVVALSQDRNRGGQRAQAPASSGSGSGVAVSDGFLLNDTMDDFTAQPGVANGFGLVQSDANSIQNPFQSQDRQVDQRVIPISDRRQ